MTDPSGQASTYKLFFTPEIVAVSEDVLSQPDNGGFSDFDIMHHSNPEGTRTNFKTQVLFVPGAHPDRHYPEQFRINVTDPARRVNPKPNQQHIGTIKESVSDPFDLAHEYGHLLGMVERYKKAPTPKDKNKSDGGYEDRIMGWVPGNKDFHGNFLSPPGASEDDIKEFLNGLAGMKIQSATPRKSGMQWGSLGPSKYSGTTYSDWANGGRVGPGVLRPQKGWDDVLK
jgi:hypothetical protein